MAYRQLEGSDPVEFGMVNLSMDQTIEISIPPTVSMILPVFQMRLHTTQHGAVEDNLYLVEAGLDSQGGRNC